MIPAPKATLVMFIRDRSYACSFCAYSIKCDAFYECRNHEEALALLKAANDLCDKYWCDIFPNAQHIRALERLLPELIGAEEDLIQARQIRRNRVIDICILADSMRTDISPYLQELARGVLKMFLCTKSSSFWLRLKPSVSTRQIYEYNLSIFINRKEGVRDTSDEVRKLKELANKVAGSDPCSTQQKYTKKDVFATVMRIYRYLNEIATITASVQNFSILSR